MHPHHPPIPYRSRIVVVSLSDLLLWWQGLSFFKLGSINEVENSFMAEINVHMWYSPSLSFLQAFDRHDTLPTTLTGL